MIWRFCVQVVLVGDSAGEVNVYLLKNTPAPPADQVLHSVYLRGVIKSIVLH